MNLADWLDKDHDPSARFRMAASLCRAVAENGGSPLQLEPTRVPVSGNECHPEEGRGAPSGRYRAPETGEGQTAGPQAQVFTTGVLCFEILSGRAFEARGGPLLRDVRPDLPRDLSDAVQACLEMDAEWRPKDVAYLQGLVEAQSASSPASSRSSPRASARPAAPSAPSPRPGRRGEPAPRPWPLLLFALAALAVSVGIAVIRLRQPVAPPALPPAPSAAPVTAPSAAVVSEPAPAASPVDTRAAGRRPSPPAVNAAAATPVPTVSATKAPPRPTTDGTEAAAPRLATPAPVVAAPSPVAVAAATPPPVTTAPAAPPSTAAAAPAEPAVPAAVTAVSPPTLRRGTTTLVDVHGVGMRGEHQVRLARGREAAKGIDVLRQRFVNPTLLQVLLKVDAAAATGPYTLSLVDAAGQATNPRPFEIAK